MKQGKAAQRYAAALLDLALEKGILEQVKDDMALIKATVAESHELDLLLHSPIVKGDKKQAILSGVFEKNIQPLTHQFLNTLAVKGREGILVNITEAFSEAYRAHKGIVRVEITSARELSDAERSEINAKFEASGMGQLELTEKVDASLIGGLRIKVGDKLMDASIQKKLNELQKQVTKNSNISDK